MGEPVDDDDDAPASWKRFVKPVLTVVVVAALAFGLSKLLTSFSYEEVAAGFDRMPKSRIALAALCVAMTYAMYVVRERIAVNFAGHPELSTRKVAVASLISRSLSTLGVATVTGFALRVRLYKEYGLDTAGVGRISVYNESTFYIGVVASIAVVFTLGGLPAAADTDSDRAQAQRWLQTRGYEPTHFDVGWRVLMWASRLVPLMHDDDHPVDDIEALRYRVSMPASIENFVRSAVPGTSRLELCHSARTSQIVLRRGWAALGDGCLAEPGDEVTSLR